MTVCNAAAETQVPVFFYTKNDEFGDFSNFSRHGIEVDGNWYPTVEHYFQSQKFEDAEYREAVRSAPTAKAAAELGRSRQTPIRKDWEEVKVEVMKEAVMRKFLTHEGVRNLLLSTGNESLIENAPGDYFWGCGKDGTGQNWLGRILEETRESLRANEPL